MGCNNCRDNSDKVSRHAIPKIVNRKDLDGEVESMKEVNINNNQPELQARRPPQEADDMFKAAAQMSFKQLMANQDIHKAQTIASREKYMANLTHAMRKMHIVSLVDMFNLDIPGGSPISSSQALVDLKWTIDRDDFKEVLKEFPSLQEKVNLEYELLLQHRIII